MLTQTKRLTDGLKKLRFLKDQTPTKGGAPGKLVFIGQKKQDFVKKRIIAYNKDSYVETEINDLSEIEEYRKIYANIWLNIDGLHNTDKIVEIGKHFDIHPLLLEDITNTGQRPRIDIEIDYIFGIVKMMNLDEDSLQLNAEQFSYYLKNDILITFQERIGDVFAPVRERIRKNKGRVRKMGITYLSYCLLDVIVDNYNFIMEYFGSQIEELEDKILLHPNSLVLQEINSNKIELNYFRKSIRPAREAILHLKTADSELINDEEALFFDDLYDLAQKAYESVESYKNMLSEQLTVYSINVNNKMNDIMKVLTIFSAIFIPLTFIAGIYGTNFDHLPELHYKHSYYIMWAVMLAIAIGMLIYFKYKKWF